MSIGLLDLPLLAATAGVCCRRRRLSSVTLPAGGPAGRRARGRSVERPTVHGGPVRLRPVRATPCLKRTSTSTAVDVTLARSRLPSLIV